MLIVFLMVPAFLGSVFAAGSGEVSRGEWISQLVSTFNMTVDDASTMPDNYYSDMTMESPYYNDVLLAVEFGVIDLDAGLPFRPDDPATREFAAHTLNFCLGFQLEDLNYTFSEYGSVTYPDDIQIALNRNWFTLSGSSFMPEKAITRAEMQVMLADAQQVLALDASIVGSENTAEFSSEVIEIPADAELAFDEYNNITISGYTGSLNVNDTFVVYIEGYPMAFIATAVQENVDGSITVSTTREGIDMSLFTSFDYSGSQSGDLENFVPSGDASYYITDMSSKTNAAPQLLTIETYGVDYDKNNKTLTATKNFKIDGASAGSITIKLTNISFEHDESLIKGYAKAVVTADIDVSGSVSFDFNNYAGIPKSILLGKVSIVPLMCSVELSLEIDLSGGLSTNWSGDLKAGFVYDKEQFRLLKDFNKKEFSFTAEAELRIGLELSGELNLVLASGSVYARAGVQMNFKLTAYDSGTPSTCVSLSGYLYASMGANASVMFDIKTWSKTQDIFTQSNSPVRVSYHYEDGALVSSCTRGSGGADEPFYCTPVSSPYFNPSPSYSQSYDDGSGTLVQLYSYEVEEDDAGVEYAVITGYNGGASALAIPSEIDGYEVREIGNRAFERNERIRSVVIPDSVTVIHDRAFEDCTSLKEVIISNGITSLPNDIFSNCTALEKVTLPQNVTSIGARDFKNCTALSSISIPQTTTRISSEAFTGSGLINIEIPDTCTIIDSSAFKDCMQLQSIMLNEGTITIGNSCFANCDSLTSITIPNSVSEIGSSIFSGCENLTAVKFGDGIREIPSSAFSNCPTLDNVVIPYGVMEIGSSAFANCTGLTSVTIPRTVTSINTTAFSYKDRLTIYGVPGTYAETFASTNGYKFVGQEHNATSVVLNATELTLNRGKSYQLTYTVEPPNSTDLVVWRTTDSNVVTVTNDGLVTAKAVGTATVLLNIGENASAQCKVTVVQPATSVSLNYSSRTLDVLDTVQLTAKVLPTTAYDPSVTWSSSDPSVASVDETGFVTAHNKGTATITAKTVDGSGKSGSCKITVNGIAAYSATQLESLHNYVSNSNELWVLKAEGATYIEVTFDNRTELEQSMDFLYVYGSGEEAGNSNKYTGTELAGRTIRVSGDTVKIKLVSDQIGNKWGFKVTDLKTDGMLDPYAEIRAGLTAAAALETDSAKLEAVRALDSDLLAEAMALEDGSVAEIVKQLESGMNVNAQVVATDAMKQQFSADKIDLTGAAMNVSSASYPVTLTIDSPQSAGSYVGTQYSNVVDFSMTLGNAIEPLEVPVMLTMPVPQGIDPNSLVIIHELKDGSTERVGYNISYTVEGTAYVSFVVTGFSDFRMAQAVNDIRDVVISGNTASVEVFCSAANTSVICASYDANGKMLSIDVRTLSASANWQDVSLSVAAGAYRVGILLIDGSHKPLAESLQFIV